MKTLKKPVVPPGRSRQALKETFDIQETIHVEPVFTPEIHENKQAAPAKILVISDHPDSRSVLRKELQAAHYNVIAAENEAEAIALAETIRPDLILLQMILPSIDGVGVCEQLRIHPVTRLIPLIFIAAGGEVEEIMTRLSPGAVGYMVKPYLLEELLARVRKTLAFQDEQRRFYNEVQKFKGHFIALVSNELRNHVTVIAGFAALLEQKSRRLERSVQRAYLQEIIQHADHLADLTDGFESLLHVKGIVEEVDLVRTVTSAVEKFRCLVEKKEQNLVLKAPQPATLTVMGYRRDLFTAVRQLLSHVHKYTIPGGTIMVGVVPMHQQARIEITTSGIAVSPEQADRVSAYGEMNLSLAIAKWVAEQQGGSMGIETQAEQGSCFWLALPLNHPVTESPASRTRHETDKMGHC